jgi:hypothetical protein
MTLAATLLLLVEGAVGGQSSVPEGASSIPPPTVVRARTAETRVLGIANCSPDPQAICQDSLIEARLEILEQVAGVTVTSRAVVRYIAHMPGQRGAIVWWLLAQRTPSRRYRPAVPLYAMQGAGGRELCANRNELMWFGTLPPDGTPRGDNICYSRRIGVR